MAVLFFPEWICTVVRWFQIFWGDSAYLQHHWMPYGPGHNSVFLVCCALWGGEKAAAYKYVRVVQEVFETAPAQSDAWFAWFGAVAMMVSINLISRNCPTFLPKHSTTKFISSQRGARKISVRDLWGVVTTSPCAVTSWQIPQIPSRIHITLGFPWWQHGLELSFVGSLALRWLAPSLAAATWSPTTIWLQMALWRLQWFWNRSNASVQVIWNLWLNLDTYVYDCLFIFCV